MTSIEKFWLVQFMFSLVGFYSAEEGSPLVVLWGISLGISVGFFIFS